MERAAHYIQDDLAPRVGSFLTSTAHKIEPPKPRRRGRTVVKVLVFSGVVGALGAVVTRRSVERKAEVSEQGTVPTEAEKDAGEQIRTP